MRTISTSWQPAWLSSMAMLLAAFAAALPTAKAAVDEPEGRIVEIAPAGDDELPTVHDEVIVEEDEARTGEEQAPVFWIGIRGRVVDEPVLRTQFQLASDMGLVVEEVLKGSPAAEAGLRKHDVLLRANGEPLTAMDQLTKLVRSGNGKAVKLLLLRLGKEETISVVPQPMPADLRALGTNRNRRGGGDSHIFNSNGWRVAVAHLLAARAGSIGGGDEYKFTQTDYRHAGNVCYPDCLGHCGAISHLHHVDQLDQTQARHLP